MSKIKRNDPCYCGSGKKYKQCHLKIDQAAEQEKRALAEGVRYVRRDILQFAREDRFAEDFAKALPLYWHDLYDIDSAEEMSQSEAMRFFDWFVYDYALSDKQRLIDVYVNDNRDNLSSVQQTVLDQWQTAGPSSAYELLSYDGQTLQLRDYFTDKQVEVYEASGRGNVEVGELILARLVPVQDQLEFSTSAAYLPAAEIAGLKETMAEKKTAVSATTPDITHKTFMRQYNHLLVHHALEQAKVQGRPPVARLDPDRPDKKTQKVVRGMKRLKR
ncbi:MAG: SEC-C domain-containing protein [Chloroflexi bacterium]|nr:SEC-C domain-containing protein [Chloroflexota bacterium]